MNQEQITKLIEVLEVGRDAAHEVAQRFHDEMKGYREAEHKQVDKDVADLNEAIAMLEAERALLAAAPSPAVALEPWAPSEEQFEQWRARHGLHHSHNEAFYDAASLYLDATPPALAGSQVQAAGDEVNEQTIELPEQAPDTSQEWGKLDGATAFHLIERHADGWSEVGHMMESWRSARQRGSRDITLEEVAELIEGQRVMILNPTELHAEARAQATKDCCKSLAAQIRKMKG